jgi:hypothetical protein
MQPTHGSTACSDVEVENEKDKNDRLILVLNALAYNSLSPPFFMFSPAVQKSASFLCIEDAEEQATTLKFDCQASCLASVRIDKKIFQANPTQDETKTRQSTGTQRKLAKAAAGQIFHASRTNGQILLSNSTPSVFRLDTRAAVVQMMKTVFIANEPAVWSSMSLKKI